MGKGGKRKRRGRDGEREREGDGGRGNGKEREKGRGYVGGSVSHTYWGGGRHHWSVMVSCLCTLDAL